MTDVIKLLSKNVSNQIASGDVIQNPASILKEILENSIDADAKNIKIILTNGGKNRIHIIDDGIGMSKNDAIQSFERYSTSKLTKIEDLFKISTKGFRGEALSYISSVTQIELETREKTSDLGIRLIIENGELKYKPFPIAMNKGCSICIKNIFYNIPAKRKNLKSSNLELKNIINEFYKIVLSHKEINFYLENNKKLLFNLNKSSYKERIIQIYGEKLKNKLIKIKKTTKLVKIKGYITHPHYSNSKKLGQYLFLNKRYITNKNIHNAIIASYEGILNKKENPSYFIFLSMDYNKFNINLNPSKTKVNFFYDSEIELCNNISSTIKESLGINNIYNYYYNNKYFFPLTEKSDLKVFNKKYKQIKNLFKNQSFYKNETKIHLYKWIQIYNSYLLGVIKSGLLLVDQNRAHQRILYDFFYKKKSKNLKIDKKSFLKKILSKLNYLGFKIFVLKKKILVQSFSLGIKKTNISKILEKIFENEKMKKNILYKYICKYFSLKKGKKISNLEIKGLIKKLFVSNNPYYSPFGEKILLNVSKEKIKKLFIK
ncbi:putative DNA mismatch repair protein MutL [Candidatus Sulcia muelleri SMDSEM]|uniref:DNA mismatch repair protein MutL n=1 Tax=Karelsulcia muelleri (strain SMDSEM) TaxID=595499 RepID=C7LKJ7_KARMS|nr:putative DNA mismatch repair protein MutL [Candidatus Karelsulcia muelleri SMDSEM]